jgi:spore coat protein U-like protein
MKFFCLPALVAGSMLFANIAWAQVTVTGQMNVSAQVGQSCTLGATPLEFGAVGTEAVSANAVITLVCTSALTAAPTVAVGSGQNALVATPFRQLKSQAGDLIEWELALAATPTTIIAAAADITLDEVTSASQNVSYSQSLTAEIKAAPVDDPYVTGMYLDVVQLTATYTLVTP